MAGWIAGLNQFTINSSQDGGKQKEFLLEKREVRLKAIEIGNDRVREALDELAKTPCVWRSHCVSEHFNTHFTRFGQSTIDESLLFTGHEGGKHDQRRVTHYSSSTSLGKFKVQSSSLRQIGRPSRIDIDLSAAIWPHGALTIRFSKILKTGERVG